MARDFIKIDRTTTTATHAEMLLEYVRALRVAFDLGTKIKAIMDHNQDGGNFVDVAGLFGVPVADAQTIYDMVNGSIGSMQGLFQTADVKNLTERVG